LLRALAQLLWLSVRRLHLLLLRRLRLHLPLLLLLGRLWLYPLLLLRLRRDALPLLGRRLDGLPRLRLTTLLRRLAALPWLGLSTLRRAFLLRRLLSFGLALLARIVGVAARLALREDNRALTKAVGSGAPLRQSQGRQHRGGEQEVARFPHDIPQL
jgi:hypothetical protein